MRGSDFLLIAVRRLREVADLRPVDVGERLQRLGKDGNSLLKDLAGITRECVDDAGEVGSV